MAWEDELNVNDPALYSPRVSPIVQSADPLTATGAATPAGLNGGAPGEPDFLFDEPDRWNAPLDELPVYQPTPAPNRTGATARPADNPYARRRTPAQGARQNVVTVPIGKEPIRGGNTMVLASGVIACFVILFIVCVMFMPQLVGFFWQGTFINGEVLVYDPELVANYKLYRDYLQQDVIYPGVFVDGVHVGGMTVAQAEEALNKAGDTAVSSFSVNIVIGNKGWTIDNTNVSATRNLQNVLAQAYAIGRSNTTEIIGTNKTPFRQRVDTVIALRTQYANLYSDATYDHDAVRQKIDEIAAYVTRDPVNSQIASFDPNSRTFTFTDDQPGVTIDADALYREVIAKLDENAQGATINVTAQITTPSVTKADMMNSFKLVAAFTTSTTGDKQRNNNINLACQAINGRALMPGETFSFNDTTGQRTTAKGYQSAGAIAAGQSIEEVGGGICQVSSTLFNAVARANLQIVSRSPHAWPSTYVKIGEDATVNWPNLDFKFTNNRTTPVFIIAYYKDRKCSAEIWGMTLGTGITIDLDSKIVKTIEPSSTTLYKQNTSLPVGASEETIKARTGYVVETYTVWYKDGQEVKRELLHTSTYKAYQRTIEYN